MAQKGVASLKEKTGRSLEEWLKLLKKSGPPTEKERREWLKSEHGLGMNYAGWIVARAGGKERRFQQSRSLYARRRTVCRNDVQRRQGRHFAPSTTRC